MSACLLALLITPLVPLPAHALDPMVIQQWHLRSRLDEKAGANVIDAWALSRGAGVVVGVVDDGLDRTHPDLVQNYSALLSRDFDFNDADPMPFAGDAHGTSIAGLIAARGDNGIGVSGAAPLATLAGLRLNAENVAPSDSRDASAFLHELDRIHILNNSWAPGIFGRPGAYEPAGPGAAAQAAIEQAVATGRAGRGRIFVWAAGNRGNEGKDCNLNGYANSRLGIAVGAYADHGQQSWYSEPCAALFVTGPSNGGTRGITTTDNVGASGRTPDDYWHAFGGTSASSATTSGVIALMLARNPALTWRDVKHILARTAARVNPTDTGWTTGPFPHNPKFGFGLIDAVAAVDLAGAWTNVLPEQAIPEVRRNLSLTVPDGSSSVSDAITIGPAFSSFEVEHVEVVFDASHGRRGDLEVTLTSPAGVTSRLVPAWSKNSGANYTGWRFGSVRHWGESAAGAWRLTVADKVAGTVGIWTGWTLRIYGTNGPPSPLTASIVDPTEGASVGSTTPIHMEAGGLSGSATYTLAVDGTTLMTTTTASRQVLYNWNTTGVANGTRTLTLTVTSEGRTAVATRHVNVANAGFTASFTSPAEDATVKSGVNIYLSTTATYGQAKTFELSVDGTSIGTAVTNGTTATMPWDTPTVPNGSHTLTLEVAWNGQTSRAIRHLTVANPTTPTASFAAPAAGATVSGTTTVTYTSTNLPAPVTYTLELDGTTVSTQTVSTPSASWSWNTTSSTNGSHTLQVTATSSGLSATASRSVTVSNVAVTASITSPTEGTSVSGTTTVQMAAGGGSGGSYTYTLTLDGATVFTQTTASTSASWSWNTTTATNGAHALTLVVTNNGQGATTTRNVTVANGTALTAGFSSPAAGASVSGTTSVGMTATGGAGPYTYTLALDGTTVSTQTTAATSASWSWNTITATNGSHTLALTVTADGQTATATRTVTVANTTGSPSFTASITYPNEGQTVSGNQSVGMSTTAPWGKTKTFRLLVDTTVITTITTTATTAWYTWTTTTTPNGPHTLRLEVAYNGETAVAVRGVNVTGSSAGASGPSPVTASFTTPADAATVSGTTTVGMAASGGSTSSYTYTLGIDGATVSTQTVAATSASWSWDTTTAPNGSHTLSLTVTSDGQTATATRTVTVSNSAPGGGAAASFTASITYPNEGQNVRGSQSVGLSTTAPWGQSKTFRLYVDTTLITSITTTATTAWHTWNTTTTPNGAQTLRLEVTYNGETATATRGVNVRN